MRAGEICGLTWLRFTDRVAYLSHIKNGRIRDVPLSREAQRILDQLKPVTKDDGRVFGLRIEQLEALFRKAKDRALIEDLHFHGTCREALTRLAH